jgi:NitT/TauT family transport system ATP-binding protein
VAEDRVIRFERVTVDGVVSDCDLELEPGALTAMIGPSGCGKSTIAYLLAGYERPDRGRILAGGRPVSGPSPERLLLFQESALMPWLTVYENVMFGPRVRRRDGRDRAEDLLERVGLAAFRDRYPAQLSGGMQRRAELARALINDPAVLILDEPFRGLDALTRELMQEYTAELLREQRRTTLFITTDVDEALVLADRLLVMAGRPTSVREAIELDLVPGGRGRSHEQVLDDPAAQDIKARVIDLLREEAMRSFAITGEKR